jgi:hypothetical protein
MEHSMDKMAIGREKDTHGENWRMHAHEHARLLYQKGGRFRLHTTFHIYWFWELGLDVFRAFAIRYCIALFILVAFIDTCTIS